MVLPRHPSGHPPVPRSSGEGGATSTGEIRKHINYGKLYCKEKSPHTAVPSRKKSLAIEFTRSIQSRNNSPNVCTVCNRLRFSISRSARSHGTTRILFFDEFVRHTSFGRQRCIGRQQTIPRETASPAGVDAGGRSFARRIERRGLERIRFVSREGRLQEITLIGKEGFGTGVDTEPAIRVGSQAFNHRNRRSPCRKDC